MSTAEHLDGHHRKTLEKIFEHPPSRNLEWREVESLLEAVGTVTRERNGKLKVSVGPETEVLHPPHGKDIDVQTIVDIRRMLGNAGYAPGSLPVLEVEELGDGPARDQGDGRWGAP
jgi:hypothetical protein